MDIQKFQQKLTEVCELGEKNGKVLKPEQIKECFGELDLDKSQLIKILQYLKHFLKERISVCAMV